MLASLPVSTINLKFRLFLQNLYMILFVACLLSTLQILPVFDLSLPTLLVVHGSAVG